jgi:CubicO group peptidase (beta-lactamase class C family)
VRSFARVLATLRSAALLMVLWAVLLVVLALVRVRWFSLPPVTRGDVASIEAHLKQSVDASIAARRVGAVVFVLLEKAEIVATHAAGQADPSSRRPVDAARTRFVVASVSKAVTAWGVMRLVEEGKLALDEPVSTRLRRWKLSGEENFRTKVTVQHLLSHTAGIDDSSFIPDAETLEASLAGGPAGGVRVVREPGTSMMYSSAGYAILQLLVEEVTERSFEDAMQKLVFMPLGMKHSTFDVDDPAFAVAAAYDHDLQVRSRVRYAAPAGVGLLTTADDLARFAKAHALSNPVLSAKTLQVMAEPQPATGRSWGLGLTRYAEDDRGALVIGHSGGTRPAWGAMLRVNPRSGNALVLLSSGGSGSLNRLPHDWVYWETGQVTAEGRRQALYDQARIALVAFAAGLLPIAILSWRRAKRITDFDKQEHPDRM